MDFKEFFCNSQSLQTMKKRGRNIEPENTKRRVIPEIQMKLVENKLSDYSFNGCKVISAEIEGIILEKLTLANIYKSIYEFIGDVDQIKENAILKIEDGFVKGKGFVYFEELNISVQGVTSDKAMKEIFAQILNNDLRFRMEIFAGEILLFVNN